MTEAETMAGASSGPGSAPTDASRRPDDVARGASAVDNLVPEDRLLEFLDVHGIGTGRSQISAIGAGHSNLTYRVQRDQATIALRRPPRPPYPPSAHDVLREARLLEALSDSTVRVPRIRAVCDDPDVLGAPFYVMDYIAGVVIGDELPSAMRSAAERRQIAYETVDALAEIHAVDWKARGLGTARRGPGYLERQLRRFSQLWADQRTRELPLMRAVTEWLWRHKPDDSAATLVHGDYRLGNLMFEAHPPARVVAVLDWEMWAIGDPLADVGYLVATWAQRDDPPGPMRELCPVTEQDGFPSRAELAARYEQVSGRPVRHLRFYHALALWKSAVFLEGSYRRFRDGTTEDPFFARLETGVPELVETAHAITEGWREA